MHLLIVDDEELIRRSLDRTFEAAGFATSCASRGAEALRLLAAEAFDCAIIDLRLGDMSGLNLLRTIRQQGLKTKVIIITAHGDVDSAIEALRLGAYDFIKKPFDLEEVTTSVNNALHARKLEERIAYLDARAGQSKAFVYESAAMRQTIELLQKVAEQPVPVVLVRGESGTGKELAARMLHQCSGSASGPFVELNCSALPEQLVESELFGHERGAFSDAKEQKRGLVELAEGGTLFLDEIGDLPAAAQAKLLKFVESHEFRRVGGTRVLTVRCRIVAATHKPLDQDPGFRKDLLYRLAGISITLPPLRDRDKDVLLLAEHFLHGYVEEYHKPPMKLGPEARRLLLHHSWPGNVRELRATIGHAVLFCDTEVIPAEALGLGSTIAGAPECAETTSSLVLKQVIDAHCWRVLHMCGGNKALAAHKLGIGRHTLARRLQGEDVEGDA